MNKSGWLLGRILVSYFALCQIPHRLMSVCHHSRCLHTYLSLSERPIQKSLSILSALFFFSLSLFSCRHLQTELQVIRRNGTNFSVTSSGGSGYGTGGGGSLDRPNIEINHTCARCRCELGRFINRGAPCRSCRLRVCKACREFSNRTTDWVCIVCHKQM